MSLCGMGECPLAACADPAHYLFRSALPNDVPPVPAAQTLSIWIFPQGLHTASEDSLVAFGFLEEFLSGEVIADVDSGRQFARWASEARLGREDSQSFSRQLRVFGHARRFWETPRQAPPSPQGTLAIHFPVRTGLEDQ